MAGLSWTHVVQLPGAHDEGRHQLARQQRLAAPGDDARLHQVHHPVGHHLRVQPEVLVARELGQHRVRNLPDAQLQRGPVGNQPGDVAANLLGDGVLLLVGALQERLVHRHQPVHAAHVEERVPVRARHVRVDLGEQQRGRLHRRADDVHGHPQAHVPVRVRRAHLEQGHVHPDAVAADELGNLREEHGHEVRPALLHRLARVGADEEGGVAEAVLVLGLHVGGRAQRQQVDHLVVGQVLAPLHHGLHQGHGLGRSRADEDAPPRGNEADGLLRRRHLVRVPPLPVLLVHAPSQPAPFSSLRSNGVAWGARCHPLRPRRSERATRAAPAPRSPGVPASGGGVPRLAGRGGAGAGVAQGCEGPVLMPTLRLPHVRSSSEDAPAEAY